MIASRAVISARRRRVSELTQLPAGSWVNSLTLRLRAEITAREAINKSFGFWFPVEGNQGFGA